MESLVEAGLVKAALLPASEQALLQRLVIEGLVEQQKVCVEPDCGPQGLQERKARATVGLVQTNSKSALALGATAVDSLLGQPL